MRSLISLVYPTQKQLFSELTDMFADTAIVKPGAYILVPGDAPVMLVAHLDTVHKEPVITVCTSDGANAVDDFAGGILMSPQGIGGDDRCGVYALLRIWSEAKTHPWLLFTCDEEIGCVGSSIFAKDVKANVLPKDLFDLKFIVQIDRKGANDAVYYDCDNPEFETFITNFGFTTQTGSFTDICEIAPVTSVAAVNVSSGYYNAHTLHEYIVVYELETTIRRVGAMVAASVSPETPAFEYIEAVYDDFWGNNIGNWDYCPSEYLDIINDSWNGTEDVCYADIVPQGVYDPTGSIARAMFAYTVFDNEAIEELAEYNDAQIRMLALESFEDAYRDACTSITRGEHLYTAVEAALYKHKLL